MNICDIPGINPVCLPLALQTHRYITRLLGFVFVPESVTLFSPSLQAGNASYILQLEGRPPWHRPGQ